MEYVNGLVDALTCNIGRTVTIFTTSGGLSGSGFTGVLLSADCCCIRLLAVVGGAPACPVGSACTGVYGAFNDSGAGFYGNPLGAICVIPTCAVACFTHNAI